MGEADGYEEREGGYMKGRHMKVTFETNIFFFHGSEYLLFGEIQCLGSFSHG